MTMRSGKVPEAMRSQLYYFTIPAGDIDRAKTFFGDALGWEFGADGGHITNSAAAGLNGEPAGSAPRLYFQVDDVAASVAKIRQLGGQAQDVQEGPSGWWSDCADDQGTKFCVGKLRESIA